MGEKGMEVPWIWSKHFLNLLPFCYFLHFNCWPFSNAFLPDQLCHFHPVPYRHPVARLCELQTHRVMYKNIAKSPLPEPHNSLFHPSC